MRRPAPTAQLSPKMLKHFAAVTVIVTVLMALLSANAQGELASPQAADEGSDKPAEASGLAKELRLAKPSKNTGSWGSDGDDVGSGSVPSSYDASTAQTGSFKGGGNSVNFVAPPQMPLQPGASITISGTTRAELPGSAIEADPRKRAAGAFYMPGEEEKQAIAAASRARTNANGDTGPAD